MSNRTYIRIEGIYCEHCGQTIRAALLGVSGVESAELSGNVAVVSGEVSVPKLVDAVCALGYVTKPAWICQGWNRWKLYDLLRLVVLAGVLVALRFLIRRWLGFDPINVIPTIDSSVSFGMLFVMGLLTSVHCVGMCGAICLVSARDKRSALLNNGGRVLMYTMIGTVVGAVGTVLRLSPRVSSSLSLVAAVWMLGIGLSMSGLFSIPTIRGIFFLNRGYSAFVLGLLNGLMPCSPLLAMQLYAMSTGSPLYGGLSMLLFGLGTVPLMLGMGLFKELFAKHTEQLQKILAVLIVLLACSMIGRNLSALGFHPVSQQAELSDYAVAEIAEDHQSVQTELSYSSFGDIAVKKGIPVEFTILVEERYLTECNHAFLSEDFAFDVTLHPGENTITFTPEQEGVFVYTCWMNMIKNKIYVYE